MPRKPETGPETLPDLVCACANLRRAARLVTLLYSHEMGPAIDPAQFAVLSALQHVPGTTQTRLGQVLGLDKTTLSRNLRILERNHWSERSGRNVRLTAEGKKILEEVLPNWRRAQARLQNALGPEGWIALGEFSNRVAQAARAAGKLP